MRFVEFDLFGVYVAPISLMLVGAWVVTLALRRIAVRYGVLRHDQLARVMPSRRQRILPVLLTVLVAAVACVLGRAMWTAYVGAPWTRDATVRA
jgi:hypothetical protein